MGAFTVLIGLALMIVIHEGAHFVAAKAFNMKATEAFFGFGPKLWSTRRGETEYGIKAIPLGGYVRIIGMNPFEEVDVGDEERTYRVAPFWQKAIVVLAGIASHFVVALLIFFVLSLVYGTVVLDDNGDPIPTTTVAAVSKTLEDGSPTPAATSGIQEGDVIVGVDGIAVSTWDEFVDVARARPGETVQFTILRDGNELEITTTLVAEERPVVVDGEVVEDENGDPVTEAVGFFGVSPEVERENPGVFGSMVAAGRDLLLSLRQSVIGLWELVANFGSVLTAAFGDNDEILDTVRPISPIGLAQIAGALESNLLLLGLVNVFVGVVNFVPLYPLDGGHFVVALYEKVTGRVPDVRKLLPVAAAVFIFLVTLGLLGIYLDIFKPLQR
jgi:membrane-associated protease RseP (regulator of RpoE activity)